MFAGLECLNIAYADDTTIYVIIPKAGDRVIAAEKLNRDLAFIRTWCAQWGMELNATKTKSILFGRSRTMLPEHPDLFIGNNAIGSEEKLKLLGVWFDSKLTFECHIRAIAQSVSKKIGILRKCWQTYQENSIVLNCFYSFILPFFEYCSAIWRSAAPSHLKILQRIFTSANFITRTNMSLDHRRDVAASCLFFKIIDRPDHPMHSRLPPPAHPARRTRRAARMNTRARTSATSHNTVQFNRTFLPHIIDVWNFLPQAVVDAPNMSTFKNRVNKYLLMV